MPAGRAPRRNDDQFYPFRPGSDYVWLTGDQTPGGVLLLDPGSAAGDVLFLLPPSGRDNGEFYRDSAAGELWVGGRPSLEARAAALGVACRPLAELPAALAAAGRALVSARLRRRGRAAGDRGRAGAGRRADGDPVRSCGWSRTSGRSASCAAPWTPAIAGFCDVAALLARPGGRPG